MKTKNFLVLIVLVLVINLTNIYAATGGAALPANENATIVADPDKSARLEEITNRVNEIKEMDKSGLTKSERKDLKNELRHMKKEARVITGGVYISAGAIIVILLLILIL